MPLLTFKTPLQVGHTVEVAGHSFTVTKTRPFIRKVDGASSMIVHWQSSCAGCQKPRTFTTGSVAGTLPLRCRACYRASVKPSDATTEARKVARRVYKRAHRTKQRATRDQRQPPVAMRHLADAILLELRFQASGMTDRAAFAGLAGI